MHTVDPRTPLLDIHGASIRRVAVDWRDTLRVVGTVATQLPGAPLPRLLEAAAQAIANTEGPGLTLGGAVVEALFSNADSVSGAEKLQRWQLAQRFARAAGTIDLKADEVLFVQACLAAAFRPNVYGPAHDALNGVTG